MARGGKRPNSGRKPKEREIHLVERMDKIGSPDEAWISLWELVRGGNIQAIKLWLGYRYGKPLKSIEVNSEPNEQNKPPIIQVVLPENAKSLKQDDSGN